MRLIPAHHVLHIAMCTCYVYSKLQMLTFLPDSYKLVNNKDIFFFKMHEKPEWRVGIVIYLLLFEREHDFSTTSTVGSRTAMTS